MPARTEIQLELIDAVGSKTQHTGDVFAFRLAQPIAVDGAVVVPAGATGEGEVIDAAPAGMGGRAGKLVLAARYLTVGGVRLPLQSFKVGSGAGKAYANESLVAGEVVGALVPGGAFVSLLITGGNVVYPAGLLATAKLATAVTLPPVPPAPAQATPAQATPAQATPAQATPAPITAASTPSAPPPPAANPTSTSTGSPS
ncbi:MAG TPA: hypothetical protein VGG29_14710 [Caulobacteraceae bacterium]